MTTTASHAAPPAPLPSTSIRAARFVAELHHEAATTRRVLERVPDAQLAWRPHAKSMTLGQLALHLAALPLGIAMLVDRLDVELPTVPLEQPTRVRDILDALDDAVDHAAERLTAWGDEGLDARWTLRHDGAPLMAMPREQVLRALMFNHVYHHRGQLTVYLRLLDVPVPSVYGPTADESPFA